MKKRTKKLLFVAGFGFGCAAGMGEVDGYGSNLEWWEGVIASDSMAALQPMMRDIRAEAKAMVQQLQQAKQQPAPASR